MSVVVRRFLPSLGVAILLAGGGAAAGFGQITGELPPGNAPIRIRVDTGAATGNIPSTLFGSFLEPIGNSTYGGLWAELLENPSFESGLWSAPQVTHMIHDQPELARGSELDLPLPWAPLYADEGNRYEPHRGDAANSDESLLLMGLPADGPHDGEVGVRQRVYLPVQREARYEGSLWVKHQSGPGEIEISLREHSRPDHVLAHTTVQAIAGEWTRYSFSLQLAPGALDLREPADFVISVRDAARTMVDEVTLDPADAVEGMDPDVLRMARDLKTSVVRFGGNFTSSYHWRDGVGPADKRVSMRNLAWGIPEYNTFGTDEFLDFCKQIGAEPQIALNLGSGTPEEAADWVRYVDAHWGDHRGGLLWELGNELWGNWNMGYPTLSELAGRVTSFSQAVRAADPNARLIAPGADEDFYQKWNAQLLATPPGSFQYLATHFVVTNTQLETPHPSPESMALADFALPVGLDGRMRAMADQIKASTHPEAKIAFTEWLFVGRSGAAPDYKNMGGAIETAGFLDMLMRNAEIVPVSDMTGILYFAGINKDEGVVYGAPGYWVLRMYANAGPTKLLKVDNNSPVYSVQHGVTRLPEIQHVPWLEVEAAQGSDPGHLVLFCINRSLDRDLPAVIDLGGFKPTGQVRVETLTAPSIYSENNALEPDAVAPVDSSEKATSELRYTFPHASVVVLELSRGNR